MKLGDIFLLHHSDQRVLLLLLTAGIVVLGLMIWNEKAPLPVPYEEEASDYDSQHGSASEHNISHGHSASSDFSEGETRQPELFAFDPNEADSATLIKLGLQSWQVRSIIRFRDKGGIFSVKEDFARVYGLTKGQYRRLAPYINIADEYRPARELIDQWHRQKHYDERQDLTGRETAVGRKADDAGRKDSIYPKKIGETERVALNSADTALLQRVPGIGSYWARRIVQYRQQLGGFYSIYQLRDMKGFPMESLPYLFLPDEERVKPLNINRLSVEELGRHPYFTYSQARAVVAYRRRHGPISSLDDLRLVLAFTEEDLVRLRPYVAF